MNDTCGPEGLVPSLLVFGEVPRRPSGNSVLVDQTERMEVIAMARVEMEAVVAHLRIQNALRNNLPPAATKIATAGMHVLVYREIGRQWVGPALVDLVEGKTVYVKDGRGNVKPFSASAVKEHHPLNEAYEIYFQELAKELKVRHKRLEENTKKTLIAEVLKWSDLRRKDKRFKAAIRNGFGRNENVGCNR